MAANKIQSFSSPLIYKPTEAEMKNFSALITKLMDKRNEYHKVR